MAQCIRQSYMQETPCKWFTSPTGCLRGDACWFKHESIGNGPTASTSAATKEEDEDNACSICFETPSIYGLLDCQHIFCLACIKQWRSSKNKTGSQLDLSTQAKCPTCRAITPLVIPSTKYLSDGPEKVQAVQAYKKSQASIPCKRLKESVEKSGRIHCPFGKECLYLHIDPETQDPIEFEHTLQDTIEKYRTSRAAREMRPLYARDFFTGFFGRTRARDLHYGFDEWETDEDEDEYSDDFDGEDDDDILDELRFDTPEDMDNFANLQSYLLEMAQRVQEDDLDEEEEGEEGELDEDTL